jgi:methylmalonyl-CoA mutase cobalamin-binding subunit
MEKFNLLLRNELQKYLDQWKLKGIPTRSGFESTAKELIALRTKKKIPGLWRHPPLFMTATIDDGWGHGLSLIHQYAEVIGLRIKHLGLLQSSEKIIVECNTDLPDFLGLTVLQFDTEDELIHLTRHLPSTTVVIAGGPVFSKDPEFAERSGIHYVAKNAAHFLTFMLAFTNFS